MNIKLIERIKLNYRAYKYKNKKDKGEIAYILSTIKKGQTVFDIGAYKAGYLYFMNQKVGKAGKVYAFEPQSFLFNYITKIKELFKWENLSIERLALSDTAGKVTLYIPVNKADEAFSQRASIIRHEDLSDFELTEEVATETLDSYCERRNIKPDFIKIDVEGNELPVFQGGINTLKKYKPKIIVEIEARHVGQEKALETFKFLETLGYQGDFFLDTKRIPLKEFNFGIYQNRENMKNYCNNFIFE